MTLSQLLHHKMSADCNRRAEVGEAHFPKIQCEVKARCNSGEKAEEEEGENRRGLDLRVFSRQRHVVAVLGVALFGKQCTRKKFDLTLFETRILSLPDAILGCSTLGCPGRRPANCASLRAQRGTHPLFQLRVRLFLSSFSSVSLMLQLRTHACFTSTEQSLSLTPPIPMCPTCGSLAGTQLPFTGLMTSISLNRPS